MPMMSRRLMLGLTAALGAAGTLPSMARAEEENGPHPEPAELPPPPPGPVVLTVETVHGPLTFTLAELEAVGLYSMTIDLVWAGEGGTYHGVLLPDLLKVVGLDGVAAVDVYALDGYHAKIPRRDWQFWPVMLATRRNGEPMSVRDKGPARILYAMTPDQVLASDKMDVRWVWMVARIKAVGAANAAGGPS